MILILSVAITPAAWIPVESAPNFATNFVVSSDDDQSDLDLNDGLCKTSNNNCTLRAATEQVNNSSSGFNITFASNMTITPPFPLPRLITSRSAGTGAMSPLMGVKRVWVLVAFTFKHPATM